MKHKQIKHTNWYEQYIDLINKGLSQRKACKEMDVPRGTIQHWLADRMVCDAMIEDHKEVIDETAYLLSSPKNAKRLMDSVTQLTNQSLNILAVSDCQVKDGVNNTEHENQRILLISDMHIPYQHKDTLSFLSYLKAKYRPTRVICLGDELDKHSLSYHESDPDLPNAADELRLALPVIAELHKMFPKMDILESNHGSLVYRKAKTHGIPKHYIKSYNDVLGVDDGWKWHFDLMIALPDGNKCYLHHGKTARCLQLAEKMGCCAVEGHYHNSFSIEYYSTPFALNWAMQVGCFIDFKSLAFNYANVNIKRPIIGTGLIIDSQPVLAPMLMDEDGNWVKPKDYDVVIGVRNE